MSSARSHPNSHPVSDPGSLLSRVAAGLLVLVSAGLVGCGYTTTELYPDQYQSIAVPYFDNRSNTRNVEFTLREALIKEIEQRTPYKVVSGEGPADTRLTGTVTRVNRSLLSRQPLTGLPQELEVSVVVDFEWEDQRDGQTLRCFRGLEAIGQFVPDRRVGEFDQDATRLAVQRLAEGIVSRMREDGW